MIPARHIEYLIIFIVQLVSTQAPRTSLALGSVLRYRLDIPRCVR